MTILTENPITKLSKDLKETSVTLGKTEARFLVDNYYQMQDNRIRAAGQIRSMQKPYAQARKAAQLVLLESINEEEAEKFLFDFELEYDIDLALEAYEGEGLAMRNALTRMVDVQPEPHAVLAWLMENSLVLEKQTARALKAYAESKRIGEWCMSNMGIGPVISAGLIAHLRIEHMNNVSGWWRFAGLDPSMKWEKGKKRPWNSELKTLCWKLGESFVKVKGKDEAFYGQIYNRRRVYEDELNEAGAYAKQAEQKLERFNIGKGTIAYKSYIKGKLPKAHIFMRCKRYAVKLFLSHMFEVWYEIENGEKPAKPYVFAIEGHSDYIPPPNW